ncbi:ATP-binding cassette subfamily C protein CydC [Angulomicrobium tetraedrale]|uniref:ATP-binding cassette subfamily C protein CydC n=1 Tax=Ancylobacter tetraedralis TaxID=217068 RepID=A0A839Z799_9HYPH|nr:ATP-binding cassette domain-containing protein [Ancylobacter tetraedralis]MBB3769925.1 ATP-binding cassette subfamily C protein CydC [Ancylobacter tetraedralis]
MTRLRSLGAILRVFFAERRLALVAGALLAALTLAAGTALLGTAGWFITATAIAGLSVAGALVFDIFVPSAGIRLFAIIRTAARYGERVVTHDAALAVLAGLRERLFRGWAEPEAAGRLADRPARLLFRLTLDIDALDSLYLRVLVPVAAALVVTLGAVLVIGLIDLNTALVFGLVVLTCGIAIPLIGLRAARRPARRRLHALEVLRSRAVDLVAGQSEFIMAGRLSAARDGLAAADARLAAADDALNRVEMFISAGFGIAGAVLLALMLVIVAALTAGGGMDAPIAALVLLVALAAFDPFAALRRGVIEAERALIAAGRVAPRLKRQRAAVPRHAPKAGMAAELAAVDLAPPGAARPVLRHLDLCVPLGETLALVGPSGVGKSTLLAALAAEIAPAAGTLAVLPATLLTQRTELFLDSLRGNLLLADPAASDVELTAALDAAGLSAVVAGLPEGLDTRLGEAGLGLSGGQARRLTLARLILRDAPLWLLDEPTDGLDGPTARDVLRRIKANAGRRTIILATHLAREAEIADRIAVLADGALHTLTRRGEPGFTAALAALRPD